MNIRRKHPDLYGIADSARKLITLDQSLRNNQRLLKCVLAEEIGHILYPPRPGHLAFHEAGYTYADHNSRSNIKAIVAQDERKALQWATSVLMPDVVFWRVVRDGINSVYDLADWFDVEEWFVSIKIGFIRRQAWDSGQKLKWRQIIRRE